MTWGADDDVKRWRADADRRERGYAEAREQARREELEAERVSAPDWSQIDARIAAALAEQRREIMGTIELVVAGGDEIVRALDGLERKCTKLEGLINKLSSLYERVRGLYEHERARVHEPEKRFQGFAREKSDEVVDLPDFIRKMH